MLKKPIPDDWVVGLALDAEDECGACDAAAALREHVHDAAQRRHEAREEQPDRHGRVRVAAGHLQRAGSTIEVWGKILT